MNSANSAFFGFGRISARGAGYGLLLAAAVLSSAAARGQAIPAVVSPTPISAFQIPTIGGSLRYSLSAGEAVILGYNGQPGTGANAFTTLSGDLAYLSSSEKHPFTALYSGGYLFGTSQEPSQPFQNLALSQVLRTGKWTFSIEDNVAYLPQTPTTGFSGISGVGDLGIPPIATSTTSGLGILTNYDTRVSNSVAGTVGRNLTGSTSVTGTGAYSIQRFVGASSVGIDSNEVAGIGTISHRLNARNTIGGDYDYASSSFNAGQSSVVAQGQSSVVTQGQSSFVTQGVNFQYTRLWTRKLSTIVSAGPQRVSSSTGTVSGPSTNIAANASAIYAGKALTASLSYSRGVNNGSGVLVGARSDTINLSANRRLSAVLSASAGVGYNRSVNLPSLIFPAFSNEAVVASGQLSRSLIRSLSIYGDYTIQRQSFTGTTTTGNAFNGLSQILGFGITYAPKPFLGH